jgi:hypothetical protein
MLTEGAQFPHKCPVHLKHGAERLEDRVTRGRETR